MPKTRLYIDVDDTIIAQSFRGNTGIGTGYDMRPGVMTQLSYLARLFDCFWLTHWSHDRLHNLLHLVYADRLMSVIQYCHWREVDLSNKVPAVLAGPTDFYWLEDPLSTGNMTKLSLAGLEDRYIPVESVGPWGFIRAVHILFDKAGITENDIKRVGAHASMFKEPIGTYFDWNYVE